MQGDYTGMHLQSRVAKSDLRKNSNVPAMTPSSSKVHSVEAIRNLMPIVELEDDDDPPPPAAGDCCGGRCSNVPFLHDLICRCRSRPTLAVIMSAVTLLALATLTVPLFLSRNSLYRAAARGSASSPSSSESSSVAADVTVTSDSMADEPNVELPAHIELFRDVSKYPVHPNDVPFLWIIPKAGSTSIRDVMHHCYHLKSIRDLGVDTSTVDGLQRVRDFDLVASDQKDFFYSSYVHEAAKALTTQHHGRLIVSLRHPHDRELAIYRRMKQMGKPRYVNSTFIGYIQAPTWGDFNWMTRFLSDNRNHVITEVDLAKAKQILREKALVLLAEDVPRSLDHLQKYFGWTELEPGWNCTGTLIAKNEQREFGDPLKRDSPEWRALDKWNRWDLELYEYGKEIFSRQGYELDQDPKFGVPPEAQVYPNN